MKRRGGRPTTLDTFMLKVEPEPMTGCWLWLGRRVTGGYGRLGARNTKILAHRYAYEELRGPIPAGMTLDHRCRQRVCVNPDHLRPMPLADNQRLGGHYIKTACPRGHPYDAVGRRRDGTTFRFCRSCYNVRKLAAYHARRAGLSFVHPEGGR